MSVYEMKWYNVSQQLNLKNSNEELLLTFVQAESKKCLEIL